MRSQRYMRIVRSLSRHWPQKITAVIIAAFLWLFVSTEQITTSQRSFLVPLTVIGLSDNQLATGVPEFVEVSVSGESTRIDALRAENIEAILDLTNVRQDFARPVRVSPPQGITLLRRNPSEVIGTVETRASRTIAVTSAFLRAPTSLVSTANPADDPANNLAAEANNLLFQNMQYQAQTDPSQVTITGRSQQVDQVVRAVAPINLELLETSTPANNPDTTEPANTSDTSEDDGNEAPLVLTTDLYAVDVSGEPVRGVTLSPASVQVRLVPNRILHTKRVPLEVILPILPDFVVENRQLTQTNLLVAGSLSALEELERVVASVSFDAPLQEGEHTAPVTPQLPEGLVALESAQLRLRLSRLRDFPAPPPL